jgi:hypothetical protein
VKQKKHELLQREVQLRAEIARLQEEEQKVTQAENIRTYIESETRQRAERSAAVTDYIKGRKQK